MKQNEQGLTDVSHQFFFLADIFKPREICRRMCNVLGKACFTLKKNFSNGLNMSLPWRSWVEKRVHRVKTHWLSGKEKVPGLAPPWHFSGAGKDSSRLISSKKMRQQTTLFPFANSWGKIHLFIEWHSYIYIYIYQLSVLSFVLFFVCLFCYIFVVFGFFFVCLDFFKYLYIYLIFFLSFLFWRVVVSVSYLKMEFTSDISF